jgi:succinate dehydrogenase/fumarate reductase flavoprotein subunit
MLHTLSDLAPEQIFDVVVIGAGGAGMSAALFAAIDGASVLLVECTNYVGGTTAYSAGTTWIPCTHHAPSISADDNPDKAADYLRQVATGRTNESMLQAFLDAGPKAVAHIEEHSHVKYLARPFHPDYLSEMNGSTLRGRAIEPLPFDGRKLGRFFGLVRPPIPEFTVLGGMMVDRDDIAHLLRITKSFASFWYSTKLILRHAMDRLRYSRGTRLVMGNALVGRLLYSLMERGVSIAASTEVEELGQGADGVNSVTLSHNDIRRIIKVRSGVILASGGFNRHPELRKSMLPGADANWCPGAPGHTGKAHDLAFAAGAGYGPVGLSHAFWAPVSVRQRADGSTAAFPHFLLDRGKPGMIVVNKAGRRFVNEAISYHLFSIAMQAADKQESSVPAYLITDSDGLRKYGLGMVRPGGKGLTPFIKDGYLTQAPTLEELARKLGINGTGLRESVARMSGYAATGVDMDFGRGSTDYQRAVGDANWSGPNPCLGPITQAPFYAIRLYPGDIGASTGLLTDTTARVLGPNNQPIPGLYACGNDMHSVMAGTYPGPGITLGPGLAFAYLAARHAAARGKGGQQATRPVA